MTNGKVTVVKVYILYERGNKGEISVTEEYTVTPSSDSLFISNLQPGRQLDVRMQISNRAGAGPLSVPFQFTTGNNSKHGSCSLMLFVYITLEFLSFVSYEIVWE